MFEKISAALMALLQGNGKIQAFYTYEASKLSGFPALTLTPAASENEFSSTTENRRVYAFTVRLYVERGSDATAEDTAERAMRDLVDTVLDDLDKSYYSLSPATQTGYTFLFMGAAPSKWGYVGRESQTRVAEIAVRVHYDVDATLIS